MRLVASLVVRNEKGRYLGPCVDHLLEFCDEVRVLDDGSTDGWLRGPNPSGWDSRVVVLADDAESRFFEHEGRTRQRLLDFTLAANPTHVLSIDADEFVSDGQAVRAACQSGQPAVVTLCMEEVWNAGPHGLEVRQDGGWEEHEVPVVWSPERLPKPLRIADRALACGREPQGVWNVPRACAEASLLHFGWCNRQERPARYVRYAIHDGGQFHASTHLQSILLPDSAITLTSRDWPMALLPYRERILAHAGVK